MIKIRDISPTKINNTCLGRIIPKNWIEVEIKDFFDITKRDEKQILEILKNREDIELIEIKEEKKEPIKQNEYVIEKTKGKNK